MIGLDARDVPSGVAGDPAATDPDRGVCLDAVSRFDRAASRDLHRTVTWRRALMGHGGGHVRLRKVLVRGRGDGSSTWPDRCPPQSAATLDAAPVRNAGYGSAGADDERAEPDVRRTSRRADGLRLASDLTAPEGGTPRGQLGRGARSSVVKRSSRSIWRWRAVRTTLARICWVRAPWGVRFPPQILRLTTAGRMACSARQLVASTSGAHKNASTAGNSRLRWAAKRWAAGRAGAASMSRLRRASRRPWATARP